MREQRCARLRLRRPRPLCGTFYEPNHSWCEGVESVELIVGPLLDAGGDGLLSPGEEASVVVTMHNLSKATFNVPCVGLLADHPELTIIGDSGRNPAVNWFAISGRGRIDQSMSFRAEPSLAPGTRVRFSTWLDLQSAACTNGSAVEFELVID